MFSVWKQFLSITVHVLYSRAFQQHFLVLLVMALCVAAGGFRGGGAAHSATNKRELLRTSMFLITLFLSATSVSALYSVHFVPGSGKSAVLGSSGHFVRAPEAVHVADIYTRLAGSRPILAEG